MTACYCALERLVPSSRSACFISFPDVEDNALAVFSAALAIEKPPRLVWLVADVGAVRKRLAAKFGSSVLTRCAIIKKNTFLGIWFFLRARKVYFTHGHYRFVRTECSKSKLINLWHGMPLKAIGRLDSEVERNAQASHKTIVSSEFFRPSLANAFGLATADVAVTGLPRCDNLFKPSSAACAFRGSVMGGATKLVVWMPTYRISLVGEIRNDSGKTKDECVAEFVSSISELSEIAVAYNCHVVVKLHPMDFLNGEDLYPCDNITVLRASSDVFTALSVYDMLAVADGLITDVSSVCFDYMATRKPILINNHMLKHYSRGLIFDPQLLLNAVFTISTWRDSHHFFKAVLGGHNADSEKVSLFCKYADARSTDRLLQFAPLP